MTGDDGQQGGGTVPAGWYPDLTNPGHERLWTGEHWIAWIRPNQVEKAEANPAGWRPDVGHPGFERLWSGEMWTDEIRRVGEGGGPGPEVTAPRADAAGGLAPGPSRRSERRRPASHSRRPRPTPRSTATARRRPGSGRLVVSSRSPSG